MTHQRLERRKNDERRVHSLYFVSFVLNVIVLVYSGLKQNHILQTMSNRLLQIYFFSQEPYLCSSKKQHLALYVETLGYPFAAMLAILVCISYFVLEIFINPTPGTHSLSHEENEKLTKFVYVRSIIPSYLKLAK